MPFFSWIFLTQESNLGLPLINHMIFYHVSHQGSSWTVIGTKYVFYEITHFRFE